ncbi:Protein NipSnap 1 [Neolecta irregularis DAH-3]|uniref:Protein NipSnap 1 n=1 Tax=Neolecta irregularis (strain DAH-3) TaxID=1198029 RepID=A0A1U7LU74_NEOID|nr:Protein NipSnap 1 [Neolecta irregularis DAH-3]|eukprot:OLL26226.1 Protein NipSnap 1 [Neolecta irregularis DAH-3]
MLFLRRFSTFPRNLGKKSIPSLANVPLWSKNTVADPPSSSSESSGGLVKSILYGSTETKEESKKFEQSYSTLLARGKYVHEISKHRVKADKIDEYVGLISEMYPRIAQEEGNELHLVGSWRTEIGEPDTFVHIWEYKGYKGYHQTLNRVYSDPSFKHFQSSLLDCISSRTNDIMQEFAFWQTSPPRTLGGIFEMRSYQLKPGNLLEWETQWRHGLDCRRQVMEPVGAWFTQLGRLNTVHHIWQFSDLEHRLRSREKCWELDGWNETVKSTVGLIDKMDSHILVALDFSPLK